MALVTALAAPVAGAVGGGASPATAVGGRAPPASAVGGGASPASAVGGGAPPASAVGGVHLAGVDGGGAPPADAGAPPAGAVGSGPVDGDAGAGRAVVQAAECTFPYSRTDATGTEVTVSAEPQRIVTLAPSAAQTMWEVGGREKVVGVSQFATYLEDASSRTNVSGAGRTPVNVEAVVSLQPDLVLAPNVVPNSSVASLRRAGLTVYRFRAAESLADVVAKTRLTGRLTGECEGAAETAAWMEDRILTVREAVAGEPRPRVLYSFFGFTAGNGTFVHEIITTAGGRNVAAEAGLSGFARLNEEVVVRGDPQWILLNSDGPQVPRSPAFNSTTAVRENQTIVVNANYVSQPGPRVVYPLVTVARALHPKAYAAANATVTPTAARTTTVTPTTSAAGTATSGADGSPADPDGGPIGPGSVPAPGPAGALAALAGGAVLAARRRR